MTNEIEEHRPEQEEFREKEKEIKRERM